MRIVVMGALMAASAFAQGRCRDGYGTAGCPLTREVATAPIKPPFAPTGWKTVALDHIAFHVPDIHKEAAFYAALMGWKLLSDDGKEAVLDIGNWSTAVFTLWPGERATVAGYCFVIDPWNTKTVEAELRKRGLNPIAENDGKGFESFHVKDPDGFDLEIANRRAAHPSHTPLAGTSPIASTGWKTVWLDHFSYNAANYKETAAFYMNLLGWKSTYDEGSQHELMIGDVGDIIIRGGNPNAGPITPSRRPRIDHISFGITPWNTDGVKTELEMRALRARIDTSTKDDIHVAAYKSYHTTTPNGFDLQISYVTRENRLALPNAVKPK